MSAVVPQEIRDALRRRGLSLRETDHGSEVLALSGRDAAAVDALYQSMQRYSFRLVLRDVIRLGHEGAAILPAGIARHARPEVVDEHLQAMVALGLLRRDEASYRLAVEAESLGPTLEWFVAEVLRRELGFCVGRGIPLRGGVTGGDLDVVGLAEGVLVLIEVKSGPPKHLSTAHAAAFLDRVQALAPHGAIFFEDTELRMTDKVVPLFEEALAQRGSPRRPERLERELFTVGPGIFIANAHPEAVGNLSTCIGALLRSRGVQLFNGPRSTAEID